MKLSTIYGIISILLILCSIGIIRLYIKQTTPALSRELFDMPHHIERKSADAPRVVSNVPLTIYQTWHTNKVPSKMRESIYSLLEMNPEFDYYLYSDEACEKFIKDNFNEDVLAAYKILKPGAYKSDLWRYCVLYKLGGLYLDIKYKSVVPLIDIIDNNPTIFVRDNKMMCNTKSLPVYNAFIVSPPKEPIFKECIDEIVNYCKNRSYDGGMLGTTGPCLLSKIVTRDNSSDHVNQLPFKFVRNTNLITGINTEQIYYNNNLLLTMYPEYRAEQGLFEKLPHYSIYWKNKDIYNTSE